MKCPHCGSGLKAPVTETRKHEDGVYRARCCGGCGRRFVTLESAPANLKMPAAVAVSGSLRPRQADYHVPSHIDSNRVSPHLGWKAPRSPAP